VQVNPLRILDAREELPSRIEELRGVCDLLPNTADQAAPLLVDSREAARLLCVSERTL
jgi:hypothetical protein